MYILRNKNIDVDIIPYLCEQNKTIEMAFIEECNLMGLLLGLVTFLIIGLFHPLVIKGEYHFGVKCWWCFLILGIITLCLSVMTSNFFLSSIFGVISFSSFWSILEVFEQRKRVERGWFPKKEKRDSSKKDNK